MLVLLRHHWDGTRLAVLADVLLSVKQEGRCVAESYVCGAATFRRERRTNKGTLNMKVTLLRQRRKKKKTAENMNGLMINGASARLVESQHRQ